MSHGLRIGISGQPYTYESYCYVPWEMHGYRGALLIDGSPRRPYCSAYVLDCGKCPSMEVAAGKHAFPVQWIHYYVSLSRVRTDNDWSREEP